jgi:hypothetical protein
MRTVTLTEGRGNLMYVVLVDDAERTLPLGRRVRKLDYDVKLVWFRIWVRGDI